MLFRSLKETYGIETAAQLSDMQEGWAQKYLGGVVGQRLIRELNGMSCIGLKDPLEKKKMIATTRMFGRPVTALSEIKEAVATYVTRAAEKLRRQHGAAGSMDVFVVWKPASMVRGQYYTESAHRHYSLPVATSDTRLLIGYAMPLVENLYVEDRRYIKAGVILSAIVSEDAVQGNLFYDENPVGDKKLLSAIDNIKIGRAHV